MGLSHHHVCRLILHVRLQMTVKLACSKTQLAASLWFDQLSRFYAVFVSNSKKVTGLLEVDSGTIV